MDYNPFDTIVQFVRICCGDIVFAGVHSPESKVKVIKVVTPSVEHYIDSTYKYVQRWKVRSLLKSWTDILILRAIRLDIISEILVVITCIAPDHPNDVIMLY